MTSEIKKIHSPSHAINYTSLRAPSKSSAPYTSTVELDPSAPSSSLDREFILTIQATRIDAPQCIAEVVPEKKTVALSLTLVPRFGVESIDSQEYVFLIDRSGSMNEESRIDFAKNALLIFMKSLPSDRTFFNIVSFGSLHSSLWNSSQAYSRASLKIAVRKLYLSYCRSFVFICLGRPSTSTACKQIWGAQRSGVRYPAFLGGVIKPFQRPSSCSRME